MKVVKTFIRFFKTDDNGNELNVEYLVNNRDIYNVVNKDGTALGFYFFDAEFEHDEIVFDEPMRFQATKKAPPINISGRFYFNGQVYSRDELGSIRDVIGDDFHKALLDMGEQHYVRMLNSMWQDFDITKDKVVPNALFTDMVEVKNE
jgi:hypothetical protein